MEPVEPDAEYEELDAADARVPPAGVERVDLHPSEMSEEQLRRALGFIGDGGPPIMRFGNPTEQIEHVEHRAVEMSADARKLTPGDPEQVVLEYRVSCAIALQTLLRQRVDDLRMAQAQDAAERRRRRRALTPEAPPDDEDEIGWKENALAWKEDMDRLSRLAGQGVREGLSPGEVIDPPGTGDIVVEGKRFQPTDVETPEAARDAVLMSGVITRWCSTDVATPTAKTWNRFVKRQEAAAEVRENLRLDLLDQAKYARTGAERDYLQFRMLYKLVVARENQAYSLCQAHWCTEAEYERWSRLRGLLEERLTAVRNCVLGETVRREQQELGKVCDFIHLQWSKEPHPSVSWEEFDALWLFLEKSRRKGPRVELRPRQGKAAQEADQEWGESTGEEWTTVSGGKWRQQPRYRRTSEDPVDPAEARPGHGRYGFVALAAARQGGSEDEEASSGPEEELKPSRGERAAALAQHMESQRRQLTLEPSERQSRREFRNDAETFELGGNDATPRGHSSPADDGAQAAQPAPRVSLTPRGPLTRPAKGGGKRGSCLADALVGDTRKPLTDAERAANRAEAARLAGRQDAPTNLKPPDLGERKGKGLKGVGKGKDGPERRECHICHERGHLAKDCPLPRKDAECFRCGQIGHFGRDCPNPSKRKGKGKGKEVATNVKLVGKGVVQSGPSAPPRDNANYPQLGAKTVADGDDDTPPPSPRREPRRPVKQVMTQHGMKDLAQRPDPVNPMRERGGAKRQADTHSMAFDWEVNDRVHKALVRFRKSGKRSKDQVREKEMNLRARFIAELTRAAEAVKAEPTLQSPRDAAVALGARADTAQKPPKKTSAIAGEQSSTAKRKKARTPATADVRAKEAAREPSPIEGSVLQGAQAPAARGEGIRGRVPLTAPPVHPPPPLQAPPRAARSGVYGMHSRELPEDVERLLADPHMAPVPPRTVPRDTPRTLVLAPGTMIPKTVDVFDPVVLWTVIYPNAVSGGRAPEAWTSLMAWTFSDAAAQARSERTGRHGTAWQATSLRCYGVLQLEHKERKNYLFGPVWALLANDGTTNLQRMQLFLKSMEDFSFGTLLDSWLDALLVAVEAREPAALRAVQEWVANETIGWRSALPEGQRLTLTTFQPVELSAADEEARQEALARRKAARVAARASEAELADPQRRNRPRTQ